MRNLLNALINALGNTADMIVTQVEDAIWTITLPLGMIEAGVYEGGLWGDVTLLDTDATFVMTVGDLYGEGDFVIGEGTVGLNYADNNTGLAYTGDLDDLVSDRLADLYGLTAGGSEQGMQGEDYLSLDVDCHLLSQTEDEVSFA
ncbi:hypothetical protein N9I83_00220 [bacterium]|nr:hypothetical protein [bacterium]